MGWELHTDVGQRLVLTAPYRYPVFFSYVFSFVFADAGGAADAAPEEEEESEEEEMAPAANLFGDDGDDY